jgi:LPS export ABC transporter permease LptF
VNFPRIPSLKRLRFHRVDWYFLKELVPFFLVGFAFFNLIFIINKLLEMMDMLIVKRVDAPTVALLFISMLPFIFAITIPISVLVAVLMAFGRMSSDSEIIALLSSGMSYRSMIKVPIIAGLVVSLFMIWFNDKILPAGNYIFKKTYREIVMKKPFSQLQEHRFVTIDDRVFGIGRIDQKDGTLYDVIIYERDKTTDEMTVTVARRGRWLESQKIRNDKNEVFQVMRLQLENGTVQNYEGAEGEERQFHARSFERMIVTLSTRVTEDIDVERSARELPLKELSQRIRSARKSGRLARENDLRVEYHKKFAIPFAALAFILVGMGLALLPKKTGVGYGLGMSLAIIFVYYLLLTVGESYGKSGVIHPVAAIWFTDVLLAASGIWILTRISR